MMRGLAFVAGVVAGAVVVLSLMAFTDEPTPTALDYHRDA